MSHSANQIVQRQDEIIRAISRIRTMRRGTLSQQSYPQRARRRGGHGAVGPYMLWQGTVKGKRFGKRVSGPEAERVQEGIVQRHAFEALCEEYVALSCELAALVDLGEAQAQGEANQTKKGLKSRSSKAGKSRA